MSDQQQALLRYLSRHGASTSAALQTALQASQATVSRVLASVSDEVIKLGAGRSRRYALAC